MLEPFADLVRLWEQGREKPDLNRGWFVKLLGFSYGETADALDMPIGTVRSRLNRGRRMLQQSLWQTARDAGIDGEGKTEGVTK